MASPLGGPPCTARSPSPSPWSSPPPVVALRRSPPRRRARTPDHEVSPREPSISHYVQDFRLDGPADSDIYGTVVLLRTPAGLRVAADLTLGLKMYATVRAIGEIIPTPGRPDMSKVASATIQRFDLVLRHFGPEHASAPGRPGSPEPSLAGEFRVPKTW